MYSSEYATSGRVYLGLFFFRGPRRILIRWVKRRTRQSLNKTPGNFNFWEEEEARQPLTNVFVICCKPLPTKSQSKHSSLPLVILCQQLEIGLCMMANRTLLRSGFAYYDMAAVGALPDAVAITREDNLILDILQ